MRQSRGSFCERSEKRRLDRLVSDTLSRWECKEAVHIGFQFLRLVENSKRNVSDSDC